MTCKDCIHFSLCDYNTNNGAAKCTFFKDKSKIIELPCKVGDTVYYISPIITPRKIEEYSITGLCFEKTGLCCDKDDCRLRTYNSKGVITYFYLDFIGKTVFLTKEAAEQALRTQNNENTFKG